MITRALRAAWLVAPLLALANAPAAADYIGVFADSSGTSCEAALTVGEPTTLYVLALVPACAQHGIRGAEFRLENLPPGGAQGLVQFHWATSLNLGDPETGISLSLTEPVTGDTIILGQILLIPLAEDWTAPDWRIDVAPSLGTGNLVIVDHRYRTWQVGGGHVTLDCTDPAGCACPPASGEAAPGALDFGGVFLGAAAERPLVLRNTGTTILAGTLSCPGDAFTLTAGAGPFAIDPGDSLAAAVRFAPTGPGAADTYLQTGSPSFANVPCAGEGLPACLLAPDGELNFGNVWVGFSAARGFHLLNVSDQTLAGSIGEAPGDFHVLSGGGDWELAPGAYHEVRLRFAPLHPGHQTPVLDLGCELCPDLALYAVGRTDDPEHPHVADRIGVYADGIATACAADLPAGEPVALRILAALPHHFVAGILGAEFSVAGLPAAGPGGTWDVAWNADTVAGDIETGVSLGFAAPRTGPYVELGTLTLTAADPGWPGGDHVLDVGPAAGAETPVVVDTAGAAAPVAGEIITLNCSEPAACACAAYAEPLCELAPPLLDFGTLEVGEHRDSSFVVRNTGSGTLQGEISENCTGFAILAGGGLFALGPGESREVAVRFAPDLGGEQQCLVATGFADCPGVTCLGVAQDVPPVCLIEPDGLDFGVLAPTTNADLSFTITNTGGGVLSGNIAMDCEYFAFWNPTGFFNLYRNQSLTCIVRYQPLSEGGHECVIETGSELCGPILCHGVCQITPPLCAVEPDSLDFGTVIVGAAIERTLTITNGGGGSLTGTVSEDCEAYEIVAGAGAFSVNPGMVHAVTVRYAPPDGLEHACWILTGAAGCDSIPCRGQGLDLPPACAVSPAGLDFGAVPVGAWADDSLTITNAGGHALEGAIELDEGPFALLAGAGTFALGPGEARAVAVRYTPPDGLAHAGWILTGAAECDSIPCQGQGVIVPPECVVTPAALDFGPVALGDSAALSVTVRNEGYGVLEGDPAVIGEAFVLAAGGPFALAHDETTALTVAFMPAVIGAQAAALDPGAGCPPMPLAGLGVPAGPGGDHLGLYADAAGTICHGDLAPGQPLVLRVIVVAPVFAEHDIAGASFRVAGLPAGGGGTVAGDWPGATASGDPATGLTVTLDSPRPGPVVELGTLTLTADAPDWMGPDHVLAPAGDGDAGPAILDGAGNTWEIWADRFTVNCTDPAACACIDFLEPVCAVAPTWLDLGLVPIEYVVTRGVTVRNTAYGLLTGCLAPDEPGLGVYVSNACFSVGPADSHVVTVLVQRSTPADLLTTLSTPSLDCPPVTLHAEVVEAPPPYHLEHDPMVFLAADEGGLVCFSETTPGVPDTVFVFAHSYGFASGEDLDEIWFNITGLPAHHSSGGHWSAHWLAPASEGDPASIMHLLYPEPFTFVGRIALGYLVFLPVEPDWPGVDRELGGDVCVLEFANSDPVFCEFGHFTFNCSYPPGCVCSPSDICPVALSAFAAEASPGQVRIAWEVSGGEEAEFRLEAARDDLAWQVAHAPVAAGRYEAVDASPHLAGGGEIVYRLSASVAGGDWTLLRRESVQVPAAARITRLLPVHPNPGNPAVTIAFELSRPQRARLAVFDLAGRRVALVAEGAFDGGRHETIWRGRDGAGRAMASGVYFVRLETEEGCRVRKLVLLR